MLQHPISIRVVFFDHSNILKVFNPNLQAREAVGLKQFYTSCLSHNVKPES
ncbi:hypothetical protein TorRG33x02_299230 [Trema orientale]|uniref:Uncharacterized protein n=1 Tax=Trema orientale TaxID=63057 RepID=A0A2P5C3D4_TREOI|nr:hypothetical protein TorRG33x02_299230 [Trema orientale]